MTELIKKIQKRVGSDVDGIMGPNTICDVANALKIEISSNKKATVRNIQNYLGTAPDGIVGMKTLTAIYNKLVEKSITHQIEPILKKYIEKPISFTKVDYKANPVKQSILRKGNTIYGKPGDESVLVNVPVPANYPLKYDGKRVKTIRVHKLIADRLEAALKDIINHYGDDIEKVAPGACVYDGSYYFRASRGGTSASVHSWGLALDFDAANNTMKDSAPKARLSQQIYKPFFKILEHHGFLSLGQRANYDWMHVQMTLW